MSWSDLPVKYKTVVAGMFPGRKIKIEGCSSGCCNSWLLINLKSRQQVGNCFTLPLQIRFTDERIIRNTYTQCGFGQEENCGGMPITRGNPFTIEIECKQAMFTININGCYYCDYRHRLPYNTVNIFTVKGNDKVQICDVSFSGIPPCNNWNATMPHNLGNQRLC